MYVTLGPFFCSDEIADSLLTKIYAIKQNNSHKTSVSVNYFLSIIMRSYNMPAIAVFTPDYEAIKTCW